MTGHRRLSKSLTAFDDTKQNKSREFPGILGNTFKGKSLVEIPNRPGFVYVRLRSNVNEVIQAFNESVSPVYDLPVTIIRDTINNRYYIKGRDIGQYQTWGSSGGGNSGGGSAYLPRHGAQHGFPDNGWGGDIVWVHGRQFMPLLVSPPSGTSGGNYVYVNPYVHYLDGNWNYIGGVSTPNLLTNNPTGTGARAVLIYVNASGSIANLAGNVFDESYTSISAMLPYLPALPNVFCIPLAMVRLQSGTSAIGWNEIFDLRPFISWWSVG